MRRGFYAGCSLIKSCDRLITGGCFEADVAGVFCFSARESLSRFDGRSRFDVVSRLNGISRFWLEYNSRDVNQWL